VPDAENHASSDVRRELVACDRFNELPASDRPDELAAGPKALLIGNESMAGK